MSHLNHVLDLNQLSKEHIGDLFSLTKKIKKSHVEKAGEKKSNWKKSGTAALLFFEPSTRTRMSFETAAHRMGLNPILLEGSSGTSLEKGENFEDTVLNVAALEPEVLVIRVNDTLNLRELSKKVATPILNAGWGVQGHPTQALLDAFTISESFSSLKGCHVLFIGDIKHSRVAASHFELLPKLEMEVASCAPAYFASSAVKNFSNLSEALAWANVVICLRVQLERHQGVIGFSKEDFIQNYGFKVQHLKNLDSQTLIMHPGPINHGVELETAVLSDPRCKVLNQVTNGVYVREALMRTILEGQS